MSMVQAMARVEQIRTDIAAFTEGSVVAAGAGTGGAASSGSATSATDFASVLAAVGAGGGTGASDVVGKLMSSLSGGAGTGSNDLASLFASLSATGGATSASSSAPVAPTARATGAGQSVVETAKQYLGVPYVWGGESLAEGGLDCSGLVQLVFGAHGVNLPRVARDQMNEGTEVPSLAQAVPGDLIVQRGGKHIGIYLGDGQMIHAPKPGQTVEISSVTDASVTTIRRVLG